MSVKPDHWIRSMAKEQRLITPFVDTQVRDGVISYGLSSYGYDMRLFDEYKLPDYPANAVLDPKDKSYTFTSHKSAYVDLAPGQFMLGRSVEYFRIPRDIITIAYGKSTYARIGIMCNITPFEPEWEGYVTLMIANTGKQMARIYTMEGIAQVLFLGTSGVCETSYADKQGKYQAQAQITHSRL